MKSSFILLVAVGLLGFGAMGEDFGKISIGMNYFPVGGGVSSLVELCDDKVNLCEVIASENRVATQTFEVSKLEAAIAKLVSQGAGSSSELTLKVSFGYYRSWGPSDIISIGSECRVLLSDDNRFVALREVSTFERVLFYNWEVPRSSIQRDDKLYLQLNQSDDWKLLWNRIRIDERLIYLGGFRIVQVVIGFK